VLSASDSSGSKLSQVFCPFSTFWAIIVLTVRFSRSVGFSRGQYGAVNLGSTPVSLRKSLNALLVNCEPLSHTSFLAAPKWLMIRSRKARIRVAVVAFRRGTSSTQLATTSGIPLFVAGQRSDEIRTQYAKGFADLSR